MRRTSTGWEADSDAGIQGTQFGGQSVIVTGTRPTLTDDAISISHEDGPREGYSLARAFSGMFTSGGQADTFAWAPAAPMFGGDAAGGPSNVVLTSGSDLDRVSPGSWPLILDEAEAYTVGASPAGPPQNRLNQVYHVNEPANFGLEGGVPNWYFRGRPIYADTSASQGGMPGPIPNPDRPMYNNLPATTNYQTRVVDPNQQANLMGLSNPSAEGLNSLSFVPATVASLKEQLL